MARGRRREMPPCSKTYGFPIYCAAWVPLDRIFAAAAAAAEEEEDKQEKEGSGEGEPSVSENPSAGRLLVMLGGGGGEGRSGVPNALVVAEFDFPSRSLSDQPVVRVSTDSEVPYRMAVHPGGDGIICSFPKNCRSFEWEYVQSGDAYTLGLKSSEKLLAPLEDVGLQLALAFNAEGSMLATGGEDGHLRVFKWPTLDVILDQSDAHSTLKDLDFSCDGKFLVSLGDSGPCRVWDLKSSTAIANLPKETGEVFRFCRFSPGTLDEQVLFIIAMNGNQAKVISWSTSSWKRIGSKTIARDPISAFSVSQDGRYIALGTVEGSIIILSSSNMNVITTVKKAHLGIVTSLVFSQDSRALASASFDSNAWITVLEGRKSSGSSVWILIFVIAIAILVYYLKTKGIL